MFDRFYLIIDSTDWLDRFLPLGLKLVQLRMKNADEATRGDQIAAAIEKCREKSVTLVINDFWQEAIDLGAEWVHLGQEDLDTADMAALKKAGIRFGLSTHSDDELDRALSHDPGYVAFGPIYHTSLKQIDWAPQGLSRIPDWRKRIAPPLVAIGGITLERAPAVFAAGADSICASTDVLKAPDPEDRLKTWLAAQNSWSRQ